jgi:signal peptidase I
MAEPDWRASDEQPTSPDQPFRWNIPRDLRPDQPQPAETPEQRVARLSLRLRAAVAALAIVALGLYVLQASIDWFQANGVSMEPTIHNGDHIFVNKLPYAQVDFGLLDWAPLVDPDGRWSKPARGDIIVFRSPVEDKQLVKRVIGLPGEEVTIAGGTVYVDRVPLDEPYLSGPTPCSEVCNWQVPHGRYFVLGDNRDDSLDSREGWFVPLENIDGKKLFSY